MCVLLLLLQGQPTGPQGEHKTALRHSLELLEGQTHLWPYGPDSTVQADLLPGKTLQTSREELGTRPGRYPWPSSSSPKTMLSFLMETLGFAFKGHFSQFLKHPKVGGSGISSWLLYITGGASIAQVLPLGKRERCRWGEAFLGGLESLQMLLPTELCSAHSTWEGEQLHLKSTALYGCAHLCWSHGAAPE